MVTLNGDVSISIQLGGDMEISNQYGGEFGAFEKVTDFDVYDGPTEVTPRQETQTLRTAGLMVPQNIVVAPIPQNYGLITWDGSTITVS